MTHSTYERLSGIYSERLADTSVYRPVGSLGGAVCETIIDHAAHFTKTRARKLNPHEVLTRERSDWDRRYVASMGITAMRYTLVVFASFENDGPVKALSVYAGRDTKNERSITGSAHVPMFNELYDDLMTESERNGFSSVRPLDELGGYTLIVDGASKPISILHKSHESTLRQTHIDALAALSVDFPDVQYVVSTWSPSSINACTFDNGEMREDNYGH